MPSVTLDTSVYIGALNSRGQGSRLFALARSRVIRIDLSEPILAEILRVLREKFQWEPNRLNDVKHKLLAMGNLVVPSETLDVIKEDPPDNRVLECATAAESEYIVTWDKDLLRLKAYSGIRIMTPVEFLDRGRVSESGSG